MPFNSLLFLPFICVLLVLYYFLSQKKQNRLLLIASYIFYGVLDYRFLILILISTTVDYLAALRIHRAGQESKKRLYLGISLVVNLGILFCFKYLGFFVSGIVDALKIVGLSLPEPVLHIILPAALSLPGFYCLILWIFELWVRNNDDPRKSPGWRYGLGPAAVTILILLLIIFSAPTGQDFIYSQF